MRYHIIRSKWCAIALLWRRRDKTVEIVRIILLKKEVDAKRRIRRLFPGATRGRAKEIRALSGKIVLYLRGKKIAFGRQPLQRLRTSRLQRSVSAVVQKIPYGKVATYKTVALRSGTRSARAVGNALAGNPFPIVIPCHRVVNSHRGISGFQAGLGVKKALLLLEGVCFDGDNRVSAQSVVDT